jgi:hypothetical protein
VAAKAVVVRNATAHAAMSPAGLTKPSVGI